MDNDEDRPDWDDMANIAGQHSCDSLLDTDGDGLFNFEEERYGTNPLCSDSDNDLISDDIEIANGAVDLSTHCGLPLLVTQTKMAPFTEIFVDRNCFQWCNSSFPVALGTVPRLFLCLRRHA